MNGPNATKKFCRFRYTEEALSNTLKDISNGTETLNGASKKYGIPKSTLHNKITQKTPNVRKMGPQPVLSIVEENRLEQWIFAKAKLGFPMHPIEVKDAVQKILIETGRPNPFKENRPGEKWLTLFLQRHPTIAKRNTEIISKSRAAVTEEVIREWFSDLEQYLKDENILDMMDDPSRIYNADETGVRTCVKSGLVLGPVSKNFKNLYEVSSGNEKESITVLCNYSASGIAAPPMVILPYKRIPKELAMSVPGDWGTGRSDSGWMTSATFFEYVANIFYNWLLENQIKFPVILFIDGHKSHYGIELYDFCVKNKIVLYCLYPNSTHILQPCDVAIFKPLKTEWKKVCQAHKQKTSTSITRYNFCPLFKEAFDKASQPTTIQNGFKTCGLYPFNPGNVEFSKCISTRRKDIFPHVEGENDDDLTFQDYQSCLKVISCFLGATQIEEFNKLTSESGAVDSDNVYALWKFCKTKVSVGISVENKKLDNVDVEKFSESFINDLPFEIDGVLYSAVDSDLTFQTDTILPDLNVNQINAPDCDINNIAEPAHIFIEEEINSEENVLICHDMIDIILDCVFNMFETIENVEKPLKNRKLIKVHSDIVIRQKINDNEIWEKHLHWPHHDEKAKKRKLVKDKIPFAITSSKCVNYYEQQEKAKREKEEDIKLRKLKREEKKNGTSKKKLSKRKHEDKENCPDKFEILRSEERDSGNVGNKEEKNETSRKKANKRKHEDKKNCLGKKILEAEEPDNVKASNEEENGVPTEKTSAATVNVGDYVIVKYDNKKYPGLIKTIDDDDYEISVMEETHNEKWKWPKPADQIWYNKNKIQKKITEPEPFNSRGLYTIPILPL